MISERISDDIPPQMKIFEYGYPHSNAILQSLFKLEHCKLYKAAHHPGICDIINDIKLFQTVYRRKYGRKFLTLSNQTSRHKIECIRIVINFLLTISLNMYFDCIGYFSK